MTDRAPRQGQGLGRLLAAVYTIFAISAGARAAFQITQDDGNPILGRQPAQLLVQNGTQFKLAALRFDFDFG